MVSGNVNHNTQVVEFDPILDTLKKYNIDLRNPTGFYGKKGAKHLLIVSTDKCGNYYITQAATHQHADKTEISPVNNFGVDSIIDLENKLNGYHKLSRKASNRITFKKRGNRK